MKIKQLLSQSINWRQSKCHYDDNAAIRLVAGISDGLEGVLVEQYGPFVLCSIYNYELAREKKDFLDSLNELLPHKSILIKARQTENSNDFDYLSNKNYSKDAILKCFEDDLAFEIHTDPRHDYGLYLDTKSARKFVRAHAKDKNVLNLFSYTCPFAVAAMAGGAISVTNIDPNKDYLSWGQRNAELNNTIFKRYPDTTQDYLKRHLRRLEAGKDASYDLIIVDPPAFLVGRGRNRLARNLWPEWMDALSKSGCHEFVIVINDKSLGRESDLYEFFFKGLGAKISISEFSQSLDVTGQELFSKDDKYYFNPKLFYITIDK